MIAEKTAKNAVFSIETVNECVKFYSLI